MIPGEAELIEPGLVLAPSLTSEFSSLEELEKPTNETSDRNNDNSASIRVRQKYGLSASSTTSALLPTLSHSKSYEEIFMTVDDSMQNFSGEVHTDQRQDHGKEVATLLAIVQCLARRIIDELVVTGLTMESEHPLLDPLCRMIEVALYHGLRLRWGRKNGLWSLLEKIPYYTKNSGSVSAVENVRQFSSLKTGSARVRAWIMLALMNKCLGSDLELLFDIEALSIKDLYEEWALCRSDQRNTLVCLLESLDAIDFNLYVKEQTISKAPFSLDWSRFLGPDGVHFDTVQPPILMPSFIHRQFSQLDAQPEKVEDGKLSKEEMEERLAKLEEENRQLRRAIISQLNQRSFFEEECAKLGKRMGKMQAQMDFMADLKQTLQAQAQELKSIIEAHEATNQSLQYQLIQAQTAAIDAPRRASSSATRLSETPSDDYEHEQRVGRLEETVKKLQFELKVTNALKDEYKTKLESL